MTKIRPFVQHFKNNKSYYITFVVGKLLYAKHKLITDMKNFKLSFLLCAMSVFSIAGLAQTNYSGSPTTFSSSPSGNVTGSPCGLAFSPGLQFRLSSTSGSNLYFEAKLTTGAAIPTSVEFYIKESTSNNISTLLCANAIHSSSWSSGTTTGSKVVAASYTSGTRYYVAQINLTAGGTTVRYYSNIVTVTAAAAPKTPPRVSSISHSDVTTTSAKLNASINPNGTATSYQFQYADNSGFSNSTTVPSASGSVGSGTGNVAVSQQISGLTPGKTYYYRVAAASTAGSDLSSTQSFTTISQPPPSATTGSAIATTNTANLYGTFNPNGTRTMAKFQWGTSSSSLNNEKNYGVGAYFDGNTDREASTEITGLNPNTTYYYRIVAVNQNGVTAYGATRNFATSNPAVAPTVTLSSATSVTSTSATLNGRINPKGATTAYLFEYSRNSNFSSSSTTSPENIGAGTSDINVSKSVTDLLPNTLYYYRIVASNTAGSTSTNGMTFTTQTGDVIRMYGPMSFPSNITAGQSTNFSCQIVNNSSTAWTGNFYLKDGGTTIYTWNNQTINGVNNIQLNGNYNFASAGTKTLTLYYRTNGTSTDVVVTPGGYSNPINVTVNAAQTTYTVTFDPDGGSCSSCGQKTVTSGSTVARPSPDPTKTGYSFDGWYDGASQWNFSSAVTKNLSLKAKWTAVPQTPDIRMMTSVRDIPATLTVGQTVSFKAMVKNFNSNNWEVCFYLKDGNDNVCPIEPFRTLPSGVNYSVEGTFTVPNRTGQRTWTLHYLIQGNTSGSLVKNDAGTNQLSVTVNPTSTNYTVTFDPDGGSCSSCGQKTVTSGSTVARPSPDPTKTGYSFDGWYDGASQWNFSSAVTKNLSLKAKWSQTQVPNQPPSIPTSPTPGHGATNVPVNQILRWVSSDPEDGTNLTYILSYRRSDQTYFTNIQGSGLSTEGKNLTFEYGKTYQWYVEVADRKGLSTRGPANNGLWTFTTVQAPVTVTRPVITTTSLANGTVNTAYNATLTATGGGTITWRNSGSLPPGLKIQGSSITGTPTTKGTYSFNLIADNSAGSSDAKSFTIAIADASPATPYLVLTQKMVFWKGTTAVTSLTVGETYYFTTKVKNTGTGVWKGNFYLKTSTAQGYELPWEGSNKPHYTIPSGGETDLVGYYTPQSANAGNNKAYTLWYSPETGSSGTVNSSGSNINPLVMNVIASKSSNANLNSLTISSVSSAALNFSSNTTNYAVSVPNSVTSVRVTTTTVHSGASVQINGQVIQTKDISLNVGENNIRIIVSAEDGTTTKTYYITVTRESATTPSTPVLKWDTGTSKTVNVPYNGGEEQIVFQASNLSYTITPGSDDKFLEISIDNKPFTTGSLSGTANSALNVVTVRYKAAPNDKATQRKGAIIIKNTNGTTPAQLQADFTQAAKPVETKYTLTVQQGKGSGIYSAGEKVTITADPAPTGQVFDKWTGSVSFANATSATTTITMPSSALTVKANYKAAPATTYRLTVQNGFTVNGNYQYAAGEYAYIAASAPSKDEVFDKWTSTGGGTFHDLTNPNTYFTMPARQTTIIANYKAKIAEPPRIRINPGGNDIYPVYQYNADGTPDKNTPDLFLIDANCDWTIKPTEESLDVTFATISANANSGFTNVISGSKGTKMIYLKVQKNETSKIRDIVFTAKSVGEPKSEAKIRIAQAGISSMINSSVKPQELVFSQGETQKSIEVEYTNAPGVTFDMSTNDGWINLSSSGNKVNVTLGAYSGTIRYGKIYIIVQSPNSYNKVHTVDVTQYGSTQQNNQTTRAFTISTPDPDGIHPRIQFDFTGKTKKFTFKLPVDCNEYTITKDAADWCITTVDGTSQVKNYGQQVITVKGTFSANKEIICELEATFNGLTQDRIEKYIGLSAQPTNASSYRISEASITVSQKGHNHSGMTLINGTDGYLLEDVDCKYLQNVAELIIPSEIKKIGEYAFHGCERITSVNLNQVTHIGNNAFLNCTNLAVIIIPKTVSQIGTGAFSGLSNLEYVKVEWTDNIPPFPFNCPNKTITIRVPDGKKKVYTDAGWKKDYTEINDNTYSGYGTYSAQSTASSQTSGIVNMSINNTSTKSMELRNAGYDQLFGSFEIDLSEGVDIDIEKTALSDELSFTNSLYVMPVGVNKWRFDIVPLYYNVMADAIYRNMVRIAYNVDNSFKATGQTPEMIISNILFYNSSEAYQQDSIKVSALTTVANETVDEPKERKLTIYPNPVDNVLTVVIPNPDLKRVAVALISLTGQTVYQAETSENVHRINMLKQEKGMYILTVRTAQETFTEKIIKK